MQYRLKTSEALCAKVRRLEVVPFDDLLTFTAGQYVEFLLKNSTTLPFSIANAPIADGTLSFLIREDKKDPLLCQLFSELSESARIEIRGPLGACVYQVDENPSVILLAGGVGISQCKAILEQAVESQDSRHFHLYWTLKTRDDLMLSDEVKRWSQQLNFTHTIVYSRDSDVGQNRALEKILADFNELSQASIYISGPWGLTDNALPKLLEHSAERHFIYSDRFAFL